MINYNNVPYSLNSHIERLKLEVATNHKLAVIKANDTSHICRKAGMTTFINKLKSNGIKV